MKVRNAFDRWIHGEDKYDAELEAVKNSKVVVTKETPRMDGRNGAYRVDPIELTANKDRKSKTKQNAPKEKELDDR